LSTLCQIGTIDKYTPQQMTTL